MASNAENRTILRWADPDADGKKRSAFVNQFASCAAELYALPGEWAVIFAGNETEATNLASSIRQGKGPFAPFEGHKFEVKTRSGVNGKSGARVHEVFVRCVPVGASS